MSKIVVTNHEDRSGKKDETKGSRRRWEDAEKIVVAKLIDQGIPFGEIPRKLIKIDSGWVRSVSAIENFYYTFYPKLKNPQDKLVTPKKKSKKITIKDKIVEYVKKNPMITVPYMERRYKEIGLKSNKSISQACTELYNEKRLNRTADFPAKYHHPDFKLEDAKDLFLEELCMTINLHTDNLLELIAKYQSKED